MKRFAGLLFLLMFVSVVAVQATESRINGLGVQNWMVVQDDNQIWLNPARISEYPKTIWGEVGQAAGAGVYNVDNNVAITNSWGGVSGNCPIINGAVLGIFLNRPYSGLVSMVGTTPTLPAGFAAPTSVPAAVSGTLTPQTRFDLFYALPKTSGFNLGAKLTLAGDSAKTETTNLTSTLTAGDDRDASEQFSSDLNLAVGAQLPIFNSLDLVANLGFPAVKNTEKAETYGTSWILYHDRKLETKGAMNIDLTARAEFEVKDNPLFAYLVIGSKDVSSETTDLVDATLDGDYADVGVDTNRKIERTYTQSSLTLGAAYNYQVSKKSLMIVAASLNSSTVKNGGKITSTFPSSNGVTESYDVETTAISLPINFAFERVISKVVTLRYGISQPIMQSTNSKTDQPTYAAFVETSKLSNTLTSETFGNTSVSMGAGINVLDNLTIDAVVRQEILFTGTYLVSGVPQTIISQISAIYKF